MKKNALCFLMGYAALFAAAVAGFSGCDDKPKNKPPVITTTSIPDAQENQLYNTQLSATDPENESLIGNKYPDTNPSDYIINE